MKGKLGVVTSILLALLIIAGCGSIDRDAFVKDSSDIYVQMFTDGEQSEKVNEMFEEYSQNYSKLKDDELYEAIEGMYRGLANGNATKYQLEAMRLLYD